LWLLLHLLLMRLLLLRMHALSLTAQQQDFCLANVQMLARCSRKGGHHIKKRWHISR
jgi:hypothetical protein